MEEFLIYIAKVSIAAGVFYLAFLVLFQKQKHFGFNRIYLPVSMLLSFVIPFITFTTIKYVELPASENSSTTFSYLSSSPIEYVAPAFDFEWYHYLFGLYILGVAGFLLHLLIGHLNALHIIRTSKIQQLFNHLINITGKDIHPFSFFNRIILSEKTLSSPDLEMIVDHEKIHVREKHTFDILFAEILFLFQWFNPFAWLIKGAVRNNLEFKTDDEIAKIYNPQKYQLAMVALADKKEVAPFLTALNGSQLKNRIIMMKQKTENKFRVARQLVILPLLAILVMGLSNKEVKTEFVQSKAKVEVIVDGKVIPSDDESISNEFASESDSKPGQIFGEKVKGLVTDASGEPIEGVKLYNKYGNEIAVSDKKGKFDFQAIADNNMLLLVKNNFANKQLEVDLNQSQNLNIQMNAESKIGNKAENTISGKVTDKYGNPISGATVLLKGKTIGVVTNSQGYFAIRTEEEGETLSFLMIGFKPKEVIVKGEEELNVEMEAATEKSAVKENRIIRGKITDKDGNPIAQAYVVQYDKPGGRAVVGVVADINGAFVIKLASDDETLHFSKNGYQSKDVNVEGKEELNVEMEAATEKSAVKEDRIIRGKITDKDGNPLIQANVVQYNNRGRIIDGVVTDNKGAFAIKLEPNVKALTISKKGYKSKEVNVEGKEEISEKLEKDADESKGNSSISLSMGQIGVAFNIGDSKINSTSKEGLNVQIRKSANSEDQPLILVNGVPYNYSTEKDFDFATANIEEFGELINVAPENIESIEVLKDAASTEKYGEKAKNGVLLIKTK